MTGERLRGVVLPHAGADWLLIRPDGAFQLDVRLTLQTDDEALIYMSYRGVRHAPADVAAQLARGERVDPTVLFPYRTILRDRWQRYGWLNSIVAVGVGERLPTGVTYEVFEIL